MVTKIPAGQGCLSIILAIFTCKNHLIYTDYIKDAHSQFSIIENLRDNKTIKANNFFILNDQKKPYQTLKRYMRPYEINHMMKLSFGDQTRYSLTYPYTWSSLEQAHALGEVIEAKNSNSDLNGANHFKYNSQTNLYWIYIKPGKLKISYSNAYRLSFLRPFANNKYLEEIKQITLIQTKKAKRLMPY